MKFLDIYSQDKPILNKIYKDVKKVIRKSDFILGQKTKEFEQKFAKYCNSKFAISCGNGTDALYIAIKSLNLPKNSEVILPAMTWCSTLFTVVQANLKPILVDSDPQNIGAIWQKLWKMNRIVSTLAMGAIDVCLWDINGKICEQPIHRLLGNCKDKVPVYSSTAYHESVESYVEEAISFKEKGWLAHKIHPHGDPKKDIEICKDVKKAVGDSMKLMLDSMWAYKYEDALRVGREIEDLDFYWYEDPLADEDIYNYIKLNSKLDIPIMCTEYAPGRFYGMTQWITQNATDILRGDVAVTGGITPLISLCNLAEGFKMN